MSLRAALQAILFPADDPDGQWDVDTIEAVAALVGRPEPDDDIADLRERLSELWGIVGSPDGGHPGHVDELIDLRIRIRNHRGASEQERRGSVRRVPGSNAREDRS